MENDIEDKIVSIFANVSNVEANKRENEARIAEEKERIRQIIGRKILADLEQQQKDEQDSLIKAITTDELKFTKKEQERIEQVKRTKALRIQQHISDTEKDKQQRQQEKELQQWAVANRLKNEEINIDYERKRREQAQQLAKKHRADILKQIERDHDRPEWRYDMDAEFLADDRDFFEYANKLIEEARAKGRTVLPLMKAVDAYRKQNSLNDQKDDLPHLQTNIKIGLKEDDTNEGNGGDANIKYNIDDLKKMNTDKVNGGKKAQAKKRFI